MTLTMFPDRRGAWHQVDLAQALLWEYREGGDRRAHTGAPAGKPHHARLWLHFDGLRSYDLEGAEALRVYRLFKEVVHDATG